MVSSSGISNKVFVSDASYVYSPLLYYVFHFQNPKFCGCAKSRLSEVSLA